MWCNLDMIKEISHIHIKREIRIQLCSIDGNILDSPQGVKLIITLMITISFPLDSQRILSEKMPCEFCELWVSLKLIVFDFSFFNACDRVSGAALTQKCLWWIQISLPPQNSASNYLCSASCHCRERCSLWGCSVRACMPSISAAGASHMSSLIITTSPSLPWNYPVAFVTAALMVLLMFLDLNVNVKGLSGILNNTVGPQMLRELKQRNTTCDC